MGYRIQYGQTLQKVEIRETGHRSKRRVLPIVLILGCLACVGLFMSQPDFLRDIILPGNAEVTETALINLAEDVRSGETVKDAIAAFCREIITNANIAQ